MRDGLHTTEAAAEKLTIVPLTPDRYAEWDRFCLESPDAWFWHTSRWLEYTLRYRPELQPRSESFLCLRADSVAAICPLIVEIHTRGTESIREFSYGGDAGPAPALAGSLSGKKRKEVLQRVFTHVDELAAKLKIARSSFRLSPLAPAFWKSDTQKPNPLVKLGFSDISLASQMIDLQPDELQLLREMRKGHRADITRAERMLQTAALDKENITLETFERYRLLHHKAAGRVTRPLVTFQMMHSWIREGSAILCAASLDGVDVGFAVVSVYKEGAYYSSSCEDPEHNHLPIGHILQWRVMQWLKRRGISRYEIGVQLYSSQPHAVVSDKELKIAFFKRGFGGFAVPFWRGEKFYDRSYCLAVLKDRAEKYSATVAAPAAKVDVPPG
jgi:hypothetical protein